MFRGSLNDLKFSNCELNVYHFIFIICYPTSITKLHAANFSFSSLESSSSSSSSSSSEEDSSTAAASAADSGSCTGFGVYGDGSDTRRAVRPLDSFIILKKKINIFKCQSIIQYDYLPVCFGVTCRFIRRF